MNDTEHFVMCLLVIHMYTLEKCLLRSFAHIFIELFVFSNNELYGLLIYFGD